jgi:hypothetical protein
VIASCVGTEHRVGFWPVADLRDERADVRFVGWSGPAPDGLARSPVDPKQTSSVHGKLSIRRAHG